LNHLRIPFAAWIGGADSGHFSETFYDAEANTPVVSIGQGKNALSHRGPSKEPQFLPPDERSAVVTRKQPSIFEK
jgi:hypothetical protein